MGLMIIPRCVTDDAELTATPAAVAALPVTNLQSGDRGAPMRVLSADVEIKANLPSNRRIGGVVLWRHTLTTTATIRVRVYDGLDFAGALQFDSTILPAVPAKTLGDLDWGIDPLGAAIDGADYSVIYLPTDVVARSIRINVVDAGQSQIQIGRLFVGPLIRPEFGFAFGSELAWERETRRERTAAGGLRVEFQAPWRRLKLDLEWITDNERTAFANLLRDSGAGRQIFVSARTQAGGRLEADHTLLCYLTADRPLVRERGLRHALQLEIEEA